MRRIEGYLRLCVQMDGSDLHLKVDTGQVYVRVHGDLRHLESEAPYREDEFKEDLAWMLRPEQLAKFEKDLELDFAYEIAGVSRFRGNAFQQRGVVQAAFRVIPYDIRSMEDLQLPDACYDFVERPRGLVLVTGPAGSGKSTSLAAMIDRINRTQRVHIMTVEDPVEFVHGDHIALINQRELDVDTLSFANALKYVLRQDPDVILVGEMRDLETIHLAITAAETGHLVFATLHTVDSIQTIDRIVDVFPMHQQQQIRMQLSVNLVGVISQTLIKRSDGRGRVAAFEVLVATGAVRNLIRENKSYQIGSLIQTGARVKMNSLDQSLASLTERGLVSLEEARMRAKDMNEFARLMALHQAGAAITPHAKPVRGAPPPAAPPPAVPPPQQAPPQASPPQANLPKKDAMDGSPETPKPPSSRVPGQPNRPGYKRD